MDMNTRKIMTVLGAALLLAACQTPAERMAEKRHTLMAEGWQPLDQAGVQEVLHDATHTATVGNGLEWNGYYEPDGTMRGSLSDGETDSGTYTISEDGTYCRAWSKWRDGKEGCAKFFRRGNELNSIRVSGSYNDDGSWSFAPGNTRNL